MNYLWGRDFMAKSIFESAILGLNIFYQPWPYLLLNSTSFQESITAIKVSRAAHAACYVTQFCYTMSPSLAKLTENDED